MFYTTTDSKRSDVLPIPNDVLEYFLNDWLKQKGHGFVGFHSATDTYHNTKAYWDMIGGTFNGHPWGSGTTVTITVNDPEPPRLAAVRQGIQDQGRNLPVHALAAGKSARPDEPQHGEMPAENALPGPHCLGEGLRPGKSLLHEPGAQRVHLD